MAGKEYIFGSGQLYGTRTDVANSTPYQFGALQDVSLDFSFDNKELYGQFQFPLAVARGKGKITGKAKVAQFNAKAYNDLFFGQTVTTGQTLVTTAPGESGTIPGTPYQVTVTHSSTFVDDLGVVSATTGAPLVLVASSPATGQYSVSAGVYTFAAADTTNTLYIAYSYTATSGFKFTGANQLMGTSPIFSVVFNDVFNANAITMKLNQCISTKLSFNFKNDDWNMSDFDFSAFADVSGNLYSMSLTQ